MAGRPTKNNLRHMTNLKAFDEANDLLMETVQSQQPVNDLIQNCDLPPPLKVFSKTGSTTVTSNKIRKNNTSMTSISQGEINKMGIMKALQLSQTRAREAEAKSASIGKEMDLVLVAFMKDSMQIFGYRQLLRLLDFQVSQLQKQQKQKTQCDCCDCEKRLRTEADDGDGDGDDDGNESNGVIWMMGFALCLGLAGIGFAIGCKYHLF